MNINDLNEAAKEIMKVSEYRYLEDKIYAVRVADNGVMLFTADNDILARRICKHRGAKACRFCEYADYARTEEDGTTYIACSKAKGELPSNCVCSDFKRRENEIR